jgi:hypothetical protein
VAGSLKWSSRLIANANANDWHLGTLARR